MGVSLALVFHVSSALAVCVLASWALRLQRDIRFLRQMCRWGSGSGAPEAAGRIAAAAPALIRRMARASGIPVTGKLLEEKNFPVVAVDPRPFAQIFVRAQVSLVQFSHSTISIVVREKLEASLPDSRQIQAAVAGQPVLEIRLLGSSP